MKDEKRVPGGWPLCPICGEHMVYSHNIPVCLTLKDGVMVESHPKEPPPLGVFVSEKVGTISKMGK